MAEPLDASAADGKSFFIETFGCQMDVQDAEKVAGVFLARQLRDFFIRHPKKPSRAGALLG